MSITNTQASKGYQQILSWLQPTESVEQPQEGRTKRLVKSLLFKTDAPHPNKAAKECIKMLEAGDLTTDQQSRLRLIFQTTFPNTWNKYPKLYGLAQISNLVSELAVPAEDSNSLFYKNSLPKDLWTLIFSFLSPPNQLHLSATCKALQSLKEELWTKPEIQQEILSKNRASLSWNNFPALKLENVHVFLTNEWILAIDPKYVLKIKAIESGKTLHTISWWC